MKSMFFSLVTLITKLVFNLVTAYISFAFFYSFSSNKKSLKLNPLKDVKPARGLLMKLSCAYTPWQSLVTSMPLHLRDVLF